MGLAGVLALTPIIDTAWYASGTPPHGDIARSPS